MKEPEISMKGDQEQFEIFQQNFVIKLTVLKIVVLTIVLNNKGN